MPNETKKKCCLCGRMLVPAKRIFSTHRRAYYCSDMVACDKRSKIRSKNRQSARADSSVTK